MKIQDIISKIDIWQEWHDNYCHFVPLFIESAKSCENWKDWNKDLFHEFFERGGDQCVSSLQQGYFTKEEQIKIKEDWSELAPMLKAIAESQDEPLWDIYNKIKTFLRERTHQDRRAATNRLIASLQPNLLCTIVQEGYLNETFRLMRDAGVKDVPEFDSNSWFKCSHLLLSYFKDKLKSNSAYDICTYPWQVREYLINLSKNQIHYMKNIQSYINLLKANKNLVLTGAPGTGKTFLAKEIAKAMDAKVEFIQFHQSYDYTDFVEGLRPIEKEGQLGFKRKDGVFVEFCKNALSAFTKQDGNLTKEKAKESILLFKTRCNGKELWFGFDKGSGIFTVITHWDAPIYAVVVDKYSSPIPVKVSEDKIIEYLTNPNIPSYEKDVYEESIAEYIETFILNKNRKYVFIIDEINRGEISKIFGELFFSIDPGCRGKDGQVKTQYANMVTEPNEFDVALETKDYGHFYVPENVYIIGTMNEIDRSVEDMDFAMQRRFAKVEVTAEKSFQNIIADSNDFSEDEKAEIKARMTALNDAILEPELGLGEAYQVGAAYFLKYLKYKKYGMNQAFTMLWDYHLKGLLVDYLRGNHNLKDQIETLKKAYDSKVKKV